MIGRVRERERKRRLLVASGRTAEPSNDEERTLILTRFVEKMGPSYPAEIERIRRLYSDVRKANPQADEDEIDLLVQMRDIRLRRASRLITQCVIHSY